MTRARPILREIRLAKSRELEFLTPQCSDCEPRIAVMNPGISTVNTLSTRTS
eukprot:COSAG05_NODE_19679_length_289_cov_0.815789_1_plen_51_part_10